MIICFIQGATSKRTSPSLPAAVTSSTPSSPRSPLSSPPSATSNCTESQVGLHPRVRFPLVVWFRPSVECYSLVRSAESIVDRPLCILIKWVHHFVLVISFVVFDSWGLFLVLVVVLFVNIFWCFLFDLIVLKHHFVVSLGKTFNGTFSCLTKGIGKQL